jgi:uncharacterized protein (TIGR02118 family)
MIKVIAGACRHPTHRSLAEFHQYWGERHGPLFARTPELRGYVQHHTLPEAYGGDPTPTHDGASMFWYADLEALRNPARSPKLSGAIHPDDGELYEWYVRSARYGDPNQLTLRETVMADDRQLFDRSTEWPLHAKRTSVVAQERIVVEGDTAPSMVKAIFTAARQPGLSLEEFSTHWFDVHGQLGAKVPGLRRYVQNHALPEAYAVRGLTHDGFAEMWFDDLAALRSALASPEWQALREDGRTLFAQPMSVVVARERVIKAPR